MQMLSMRIIIVGVLVLVLHIAAALGSAMCRRSATAEYRATQEQLSKQWSGEDGDKERAHEDSLEKDLGVSHLDLAIHDSRLDIRLTIKKLAQTALTSHFQEADKGTVEVDVDRFTDFKVFVRVQKLPNNVDMAKYLKEIFSRIDPEYVVEFTLEDGKDFRIINQEKLLRVGDWKTAEVDAILRACF